MPQRRMVRAWRRSARADDPLLGAASSSGDDASSSEDDGDVFARLRAARATGQGTDETAELHADILHEHDDDSDGGAGSHDASSQDGSESEGDEQPGAIPAADAPEDVQAVTDDA